MSFLLSWRKWKFQLKIQSNYAKCWFLRDATLHFLEGSPCFWCLVMYLYSCLIEGTVLTWKSFSNPPILPSDIELPFQQLPNLVRPILWSNKELQIRCWNSKKVETLFSLICLMAYSMYLWKFRKHELLVNIIHSAFLIILIVIFIYLHFDCL